MSKNINKKSLEIDEKFISLAEAAKRSGYTPEHLNLSARKGKLEAAKIGRNWYTTSVALEAFLKLKKKAEEKNIQGAEDVQNVQDVETVEEKENEDFSQEIISVLETKNISDEKEKKSLFPKFSFFKNWMRAMAGVSAIVIMLPMIFFSVYMVKFFAAQKKSNNEKIALIDRSPSDVIMNETGSNLEESAPGAQVLGIVSGEEATADPEAQKKSGTVLTSENFKAQNVSLGVGIILANAEENVPLEISDIKSESYITGKKNNANSKEEVKMVVSWKTNKPAISQLDFSKNNGQDQKVFKEQSFGMNHAVVLTQIDPRTSYIYQVKSKDHWGAQVGSDFYGVFTTSKPVSVFDLITQQINDIFGWAIKN